MRIRTARTLAAASFLAAGLMAFPGCNAANAPNRIRLAAIRPFPLPA